MCRAMTVVLASLFLLFFEAASLRGGEPVQGPQPREGDVWRFQVSHKDWIEWSSEEIQSGNYEVSYTQGKLKVFSLSNSAKGEIGDTAAAPLRRLLGPFKGQSALLQFPLFESKKWKTRYAIGRGDTVTTDHLVTGTKSIDIPAGTFEAFRIERYARVSGRYGRVYTSEYFYVVACGCIALYSLEITSAPSVWPRRYIGKREITLIEFRSMKGQVS
jgi:hypothetical protein